MDNVTVLIIDDHVPLAYGLKLVCEDMSIVSVVGMAETGQLGIMAAREIKPDVVILDLSLPDINGIEVAQVIKREMPETHVIIYSGDDDLEMYHNALIAIPVDGIMHKRVNSQYIQGMLTCVIHGVTLLPQENFHKLRLAPERKSVLHGLRDTEMKILQLVGEGIFRYDELALRLSITRLEAETYVTQACRKLGVLTMEQAVQKYNLMKYQLA